MTIHDDVQEVLLTEDQIQGRVAELGVELAHDYADQQPVLVSVLKGDPSISAARSWVGAGRR